MRNFNGYSRTVCDCYLCSTNCKFMPGYLMPDDIEHISNYLSPCSSDLFKFAEEHLLASPGALVMKDGKPQRIHTLVPGRNKVNNYCKFHNNDLCDIHSVAPFGCAFFDSHQTQNESNIISIPALRILYIIWNYSPDHPYCQIWNHLNSKNLNAPGPEECRRRMNTYLGI